MSISHTSKFFNRVLLLIAFFTILFTTVHAAKFNLTDSKVVKVNLAFEQYATQSSNYHSHNDQFTPIRYQASNAVDGNTDGSMSRDSVTRTKNEKGAWWKVDLGSEKKINRIVIYNRTDCCKKRLKNYRVSISTKVNFKTHTYQQDFHDVPDPKKSIFLGRQGIQGRYVKIQLLGKNFLSLAEVRVMGSDVECDWACQLGSANSIGGEHRCALKTYDRVVCWGRNNLYQATPPKGLIAKQIALGTRHSCAIKMDGSVKCWGSNHSNESEVPKGLIAKQIALGTLYSCALTNKNKVVCWGYNIFNQTTPPKGLKAKQIASGSLHSCAIGTDNSVACWGNNSENQATPPKGLIAKQITLGSFFSCAIKMNDSVTCWGNNSGNQATPPKGLKARQIASGYDHTCAIKMDDSVVCWGDPSVVDFGAPEGLIAKKVISATRGSCAIKKMDNSVVCWGAGRRSANRPPKDLIAEQL